MLLDILAWCAAQCVRVITRWNGLPGVGMEVCKEGLDLALGGGSQVMGGSQSEDLRALFQPANLRFVSGLA